MLVAFTPEMTSPATSSLQEIEFEVGGKGDSKVGPRLCNSHSTDRRDFHSFGKPIPCALICPLHPLPWKKGRTMTLAEMETAVNQRH